jgi:hypothetical protein
MLANIIHASQTPLFVGGGIAAGEGAAFLDVEILRSNSELMNLL